MPRSASATTSAGSLMSFFIVAPPSLPALAREPIVAHRVRLREFHDRGLATLTRGAGREDDRGATP